MQYHQNAVNRYATELYIAIYPCFWGEGASKENGICPGYIDSEGTLKC